MEAQCGGIGNVEDFLNSIESVNGDERFAPYLRGVTNTWNFASPGDTEMRLTDAGFDSARCWLEDAPVQPEDPRAFIETVCLGRASGPAALRAPGSIHGRGARGRPAAADAGLRAAEHLGEPAVTATRIVLLPGDGIGPEIVAAARRLLESLGEFEFSEHLVGGASIDAHGEALTDEVLEACRDADAVLLGAVGGPKWDTTDPVRSPPRAGPARPPKGAGPLRQPPAGAPEPGARRGQSAARRAHRGHGPARGPRADGRDLLRGQRPRWRGGPRHL